MLADSEQQFFRVSQQSAFEKHQGDVCVEPLNEEDVPVLKRVAGLAPLDFPVSPQLCAICRRASVSCGYWWRGCSMGECRTLAVALVAVFGICASGGLAIF